MKKIRELNETANLQLGDMIPCDKADTGLTRKFSIAVIKEYITNEINRKIDEILLPRIKNLEESFPLLESKYSETKLGDCWLASQEAFYTKQQYPWVYDYLYKIYSYEITNPNISVIPSVYPYGVYDFVIDLQNQTFRLPINNGSESIAGPVDKAIPLIKGASSSTLTMTRNGVFAWSNINNAPDLNNPRYLQIFYKNSDYTNNAAKKLESRGGSQQYRLTINAPVKRGDVIVLEYNVGGAVEFFGLIPNVGNGTLYYYIGKQPISDKLNEA
ncbi:MAG: hypothetical protein SOT71_08070 [Romboutsia timonensis]|uniref:hypothetical protein n=1 Tax=Romboutsia timonensis TaxID=1776391 RepID=UPI002A75D8B1|nr:hypothetical protein [Romboutsia timonensis]MDY2882594.1 hypothetical protein [Romboutsia timonensis]